MFYIYVHTRKTDGLPFYVGKGRNRRAKSAAGRNQYWQRVNAKHGRDVQIVADGLDEELAFLAEMELIDKFRRLGFPLTNVTDGGDGISLSGAAAAARARSVADSQRTPEARARRSEISKTMWSDPSVRERISQGIRKANSHPDIAAKFSAIRRDTWARPGYRERISAAISAAFSRPDSLAKKSAASKLAAAKRRVSVTCVNTGQVFASMSDAALWLRQNGWPKAIAAKICLACQGARTTAYGYAWAYTERNACSS